MKNLQLLLRRAVIIGLVFSLQSCSYLFLRPKEVDLTLPQPDVRITYMQNAAGVWYYEEIQKNPDEFKLDPKEASVYPIRYSKKGYYPAYMLISKTQFNWGVPIDLLAIAAGTYFLAQDSLVQEETYYIGGGLFVGAVGNFIFSDYKNFSRKLSKPELKKLPTRTETQKPLSLSKIEWNLAGKDHEETYYRDVEDYEENDPKKTIKSARDYKTRMDRIFSGLQSQLGEQGYRDTASKVYASAFEPYSISAEIIRLNENYLGPLVTYDLGVRWKLTNNITDEEVHSAVLNSKTQWGYNALKAWDQSESMYFDAMSRTMFDFVKSWPVTNFLLDDEDALASLYYNWGKMAIKNRKKVARNLKEAKQAVVSLSVENGHGSAFFISDDGLLISNYHIIKNENLDSLFIEFPNGKRYKAEVVRSNPVHDLILLKADVEPKFILRPGSRQTFQPGDKVYAIGTPENLDLIQTITKGVISHERTAYKRSIIQSDVSINAGHSGGALLDENANLIGVLNAKWTGLGVEGISFAQPAFYIRESLKLSFQ